MDRPEDAVEVIRQGLEQIPENPTLSKMLIGLQVFDKEHPRYRSLTTNRPTRESPIFLTTHNDIEAQQLAFAELSIDDVKTRLSILQTYLSATETSPLLCGAMRLKTKKPLHCCRGFNIFLVDT